MNYDREEAGRLQAATEDMIRMRSEPPAWHTAQRRQRSTDEYHLAQLRHAYKQLAAGSVVDQKQFAEGLIAPAIRHLENKK